MNTIIRIAAGLLVGAGLTSTALAGEPVITGTGTDTTITAPNPDGPVWGGAIVRQVGSGESAQIEVLDVQHTQPGRIARVVGSGESAQVVYDAPAPAAQASARAGVRG
jgi:hypothetical protein